MSMKNIRKSINPSTNYDKGKKTRRKVFEQNLFFQYQ